MRLMPHDNLYEYVAWFHDETLVADDDYEWPGVIGIWANDCESALAWGDELAKTCGGWTVDGSRSDDRGRRGGDCGARSGCVASSCAQYTGVFHDGRWRE
jgi:hypothetical protein